MRISEINRLPILLSVAAVATALTISLAPAYAQHGSGGHGGGHSTSEADHADGVHDTGKGGPGGSGMGHGSGGSSQSLSDIFHGMDAESESDHSSATTDSHGSKKGSAASSRGKHDSTVTTVRGKKGSTTAGKKTGTTMPKAAEEEEEDSDRPAWAGKTPTEETPGRGNVASGTTKGEIFGDMYVVLRDDNGIPELKAITLADGTTIYVVQPVDADGNKLELDAEGNLVDPDAAIPVELGRLNVGRSPTAVLDQQYLEVLKSINSADSVTVDASGRLVLVTDGVESAIDSPLANLALYVTIMNDGTITAVTTTDKDGNVTVIEPAPDPDKFAEAISYLVDTTKTTADLLSAASFLAAAADKTGTLTIDKIVDMNTVLGVTGTLPSQDPNSTLTYVDYSTFSYDRESVYDGVMITVLVKQDDGSYLPTEVNVYQAVFDSTNYTSTSGVDGFTQAADDALQVIEYVHDNSAPTTE